MRGKKQVRLFLFKILQRKNALMETPLAEVLRLKKRICRGIAFDIFMNTVF